MATSSEPSGYIPKVHHLDVMRGIPEGIVATGDVVGTKVQDELCSPSRSTIDCSMSWPDSDRIWKIKSLSRSSPTRGSKHYLGRQ